MTTVKIFVFACGHEQKTEFVSNSLENVVGRWLKLKRSSKIVTKTEIVAGDCADCIRTALRSPKSTAGSVADQSDDAMALIIRNEAHFRKQGKPLQALEFAVATSAQINLQLLVNDEFLTRREKKRLCQRTKLANAEDHSNVYQAFLEACDDHLAAKLALQVVQLNALNAEIMSAPLCQPHPAPPSPALRESLTELEEIEAAWGPAWGSEPNTKSTSSKRSQQSGKNRARDDEVSRWSDSEDDDECGDEDDDNVSIGGAADDDKVNAEIHIGIESEHIIQLHDEDQQPQRKPTTGPIHPYSPAGRAIIGELAAFLSLPPNTGGTQIAQMLFARNDFIRGGEYCNFIAAKRAPRLPCHAMAHLVAGPGDCFIGAPLVSDSMASLYKKFADGVDLIDWLQVDSEAEQALAIPRPAAPEPPSAEPMTETEAAPLSPRVRIVRSWTLSPETHMPHAATRQSRLRSSLTYLEGEDEPPAYIGMTCYECLDVEELDAPTSDTSTDIADWSLADLSPSAGDIELPPSPDESEMVVLYLGEAIEWRP